MIFYILDLAVMVDFIELLHMITETKNCLFLKSHDLVIHSALPDWKNTVCPSTWFYSLGLLHMALNLSWTN